MDSLVDKDYKEIPLGRTSKRILVSIEDYDHVSQWKWHNRQGYAIRVEWLNKNQTRRKTYQMHREIMNPPEGLFVDHINGDTLDNRRGNLRTCSQTENARNRIKYTPTTSRYKGVSWSKDLQQWIAYIRVDDVLKHLSYFSCEIEAAKCYNAAAKEYFGEFAKLNDISLEDNRSWQQIVSESRYKYKQEKYKSGYIGVSWNSRLKQWIASIIVKGGQKYLGAYKDEFLAAQCFDAASYEFFGNEKARNFPSIVPHKTWNDIYRENSNKTSQFIGVRQTKTKKWDARVNSGRKPVYLGTFESELDAALARDAYVAKHNLKRIKLNFP